MSFTFLEKISCKVISSEGGRRKGVGGVRREENKEISFLGLEAYLAAKTIVNC